MKSKIEDFIIEKIYCHDYKYALFAKKPKYLLFCSYCDMIYKNDLIKFKYNSSQKNFYQKITEKNKDNNSKLVTFKKYHCNIINDSIK